jgi:putative ABC transport system permease protein
VKDAEAICIIGADIEDRFFAGEEALGKKIKAGNIWFTVVGVLEKRDISTENIENLGIRNYNLDIYTPATTVLLRYKNRALVTGQDIQSAASDYGDDEGASNGTSQNYNQLDKLIVQVSDNKFSVPISDVMRRMLERRHNGVIDFEVIVIVGLTLDLVSLWALIRHR